VEMRVLCQSRSWLMVAQFCRTIKNDVSYDVFPQIGVVCRVDLLARTVPSDV
jgi:hypothetical protein